MGRENSLWSYWMSTKGYIITILITVALAILVVVGILGDYSNGLNVSGAVNAYGGFVGAGVVGR